MSCCDICDELASIKAEQAWEREALTLLLLHAGLQIPGTTPSGFQVDAVHVGSGNWISLTAGWADSPQGSAVLWHKNASTDARDIFGFDGLSPMLYTVTNNGRIGGALYDSTESNYVYMDSPNPGPIAVSTWQPIFMDWKTDESAGNKIIQVYVGDSPIGGTIEDDGTSSFTVPWNGNVLVIGKALVILDDFDGDLAEFWLDTTRLDFSVEANRRKFYSATGKPVDVGSDGSTPTGSAPEVYLSVRPGDAASDFVTNRGTGGNFTQNGTLTLASTSPSD